MSTLLIRRWIALGLALILTASLLVLPTYALPWGSESETANGRADMTDPPPIGEGLPGEGAQEHARGNLGDTNGDGIIERENTPATEQDPMHAAEELTSRRGGWVIAMISVLAVVAVILLIVALVPKKRI